MNDMNDPVVYGKSVAEAMEAYKKAHELHEEATYAADDKYYVEMEAIKKPHRDFAELVRRELGDYSNSSDGLVKLFTALTEGKRNARQNAAAEARHKAVAAAADELNKSKQARYEALSVDPFTHWLNTFVRRQFNDHADMILGILPATMNDIKTLADSEDWCTGFERIAAAAADRGLIDEPHYKVTRRIDYYGVPDDLNSNAGDVWEVDVQVPGYMREHKYDTDNLIYYSGGDEFATYRRVSPAPETGTA
jgi:hypothetical protein